MPVAVLNEFSAPESTLTPIREQPALRRLVLVAGSGRSGTSTITGILKELGVHVPQPEVPADDTNPRGFGEPQWLVDFHRRLLRRAGVQVSDARPEAWFRTGRSEVAEDARTAATTWLEDQFLAADEVVLKDPRLIWFFGLWQSAALRLGAELSVVTMLRPPAEVVGSKRNYYGHRGEIDSVAGWLNLMLNTERATRGCNRSFVRYHDLLDDWTVPIFELGEDAELTTIRGAGATKINQVHRFIDPGLRRMATGWEDLDIPQPLKQMATEAWDLLDGIAVRRNADSATCAALDELAQRYARYYTEAEAVAASSVLANQQQITRLERRRDQLLTTNQRLKDQIAQGQERRAALKKRVDLQQRRIAELERERDRGAYERIVARVPIALKQRVPESWRVAVRRAAVRQGAAKRGG